MDKNIIYCILFILIVLSACNNTPKLLDETEDEEFYIKKFQLNGEPEIMVLEYFKDSESLARKYFIHEGKLYGEDSIFYFDGSIQIVRRYNDGNLHGNFIGFYENGDTMVLQDYKNGKIMFQEYYFPDGSLRTSIQNNVTKSFFYTGKLKMIRKFLDDKTIYGTIEFNENREIVEAYGKFDFLTSQDSILLESSYPDWERRLDEFLYKQVN